MAIKAIKNNKGNSKNKKKKLKPSTEEKPEQETQEQPTQEQEQQEQEQEIPETPLGMSFSAENSFSLQDEKEIEEILGINVPSKEKMQTREIEEQQVSRQDRREKKAYQENQLQTLYPTQAQPFYGQSTEYSQSYENNNYKQNTNTINIKEGGLERIIPLSKELKKNRHDAELNLIPSFNGKLTPVEELFLNPIGDSYIKEQENIRKKEKIK